jgi:uncharacterized delta-60 repeat protein
MRYPNVFMKVVLLLAILFAQRVALLPECQGAEGWPKRYNGPANDYDYPYAIAVDAQGNVYVTGQSKGVSSAFDYATLKYSPDGGLLWAKRYNGPGNDYDYVYALAVDAQGNVYVTGGSKGVSSDIDYATLKYSPAGERLWVRRYNGPANGYDCPSAIAVDAQGNVYVTGQSTGISSGSDYTTIKYSPAGEVRWAKRYDGPGNGYDYPNALAVDAQGNVYVTGCAYGTGSSWDYATLKYSPDGDRLWVRRYNGPGNDYDHPSAIAVDAQGNVYVTGQSKGAGSDFDYATLKYSPAGKALWEKRYNGPGNGGDAAYALAVDPQGNVYVTGASVGALYGDYATLKYSPAGGRLWVRRYNGAGKGDDEAKAIAMDSQGNVYVTGLSAGDGSGSDYATLKYSPTGVQLWEQRYNGPGNDCDEAKAIVVDSQGNVYATGASVGVGSSFDYATIKYGPE